MPKGNAKDVLLHVHVQPKASCNRISIEPDGRIRVALTAPPVDGAANEALRDLLAKALGLPRRAVTLVRGEKSREKTVSLTGVSADQVRQLLKSS